MPMLTYAQLNNSDKIISQSQKTTVSLKNDHMTDNKNIFPYSKFVPAFATLAAALIGSFFGPWFAFRLQKQEKVQKMKVDNITAGNLALFTISRQFQTLGNLRKQFIDPVREHPLRFIAMRPVVPFLNSEDFKFDIGSLSFFLEPHRQRLLQQTLRQTLNELVIEDERFKTVVNALNWRSKLHVEQIQPLLDQAKVRMYPDQIQIGVYEFLLPQNADTALPHIQTALGYRLYQTILQSTNNVIEILDESLISLLRMRDTLVSSLNQLFPNNIDDILHFEPL